MLIGVAPFLRKRRPHADTAGVVILAASRDMRDMREGTVPGRSGSLCWLYYRTICVVCVLYSHIVYYTDRLLGSTATGTNISSSDCFIPCCANKNLFIPCSTRLNRFIPSSFHSYRSCMVGPTCSISIKHRLLGMTCFIAGNISTTSIANMARLDHCIMMDSRVLRIMVNGGVLGIMMHRLGLRDPVVRMGRRRCRRGTAAGAAT